MVGDRAGPRAPPRSFTIVAAPQAHIPAADICLALRYAVVGSVIFSAQANVLRFFLILVYVLRFSKNKIPHQKIRNIYSSAAGNENVWLTIAE